MTSEREGKVANADAEIPRLNADHVEFLARLAGVELGEERAAGLVPQAEPHFSLMRALDGIDAKGAEPAAEFRLDEWRRPKDA
jgi:Asp-tRNA(Asn)/Glu-tRNA(Gln) amidotransferase C subunit